MTTWMKLKDTMFSEKSQTQKNNHCMISHVESKLDPASGVVGVETGRCVWKGTTFHWCRVNSGDAKQGRITEFKILRLTLEMCWAGTHSVLFPPPPSPTPHTQDNLQGSFHKVYVCQKPQAVYRKSAILSRHLYCKVVGVGGGETPCNAGVSLMDAWLEVQREESEKVAQSCGRGMFTCRWHQCHTTSVRS